MPQAERFKYHISYRVILGQPGLRLIAASWRRKRRWRNPATWFARWHHVPEELLDAMKAEELQIAPLQEQIGTLNERMKETQQ